jgi:hypothetical protein
MSTIDPVSKNPTMTDDANDSVRCVPWDVDFAASATAAVTIPPGHILQDGTYVNISPPSEFEKTRFFERSVARHGLLQDDLETTKKRSRDENADEQKQENDDKSKNKKLIPQIHPLARASAFLQSNGISELNRAINLHTLVATGEYFGLSNIVDPSLDRATGKPSSETKETDSGRSRVGVGPATSATSDASSGTTNPVLFDEEEARVRAVYILQRKQDLYHLATATLKRHRRRLIAAIRSQQQIDNRWRELRPFWRLVAPEHGTRAHPHPVKTTEVICADVDVYYHNGSQIGRLAGHVPRYATLQLSEDFSVARDVRNWKNQTRSVIGNTDPMDVDDKEEENVTITGNETMSSSNDSAKNISRIFTKAQPYVIADPSIGKLDADFDPTKVTMLTLQFKIENPSTGYYESMCIEPTSTARDRAAEALKKIETSDDEMLLVILQHSLFCAKLFESMRRELAPDTENIGQVHTTSTQTQSVSWLTGQSNQNFLPTPSLMIGSDQSGLSPLCVVHVHEGDFKVLLDCEYTLNVQLVESDNGSGETLGSKNSSHVQKSCSRSRSGSQNPEQLRILCQALLLHAQETYHRHSIRSEAKLRKEQYEDEQRHALFLKENPHVKVVPPIKTKDTSTSPATLQNCISLGAKMLFESRIRKTLRSVKDWLHATTSCIDETLHVEWLALSVFDLAAQFTVSFRSWYIDANIVCDELTVTSFAVNGDFRKVKFHRDKEFELYLKTALRRVLRAPKA